MFQVQRRDWISWTGAIQISPDSDQAGQNQRQGLIPAGKQWRHCLEKWSFEGWTLDIGQAWSGVGITFIPTSSSQCTSIRHKNNGRSLCLKCFTDDWLVLISHIVQMRDLVNKKSFLLRKKLDNLLHWLSPGWWVPLYTSVTFSRMRYHQCIKNRSATSSFRPHVWYFLLLESGKTRPWRGSPQQQAWPPWPPSGWSPTINLPHSWPTPSWPTSQSKSQGWSSSVRIYENFNSAIGTVGRHLAHDVF